MSSIEAEKFINDAGQVRNVSNARGRLVQPAVRYLRHHEREKRKDEANRIRSMLDPVNIQLAKMGSQSISQARQHLNALEDDLEKNSPPTDLSGSARDALWKELKREEDIYRQGLLTHEQMRRNHVGAVDRHIRHERTVVDGMTNKTRALKIKNLRVLINPDSDEQDLANLEDLRSHGIMPGVAQPYTSEAQIPGVFAMSPLAKQNWPEGMPEYGTVNSPYKQLEAKERQELEALRKENADLAAQLKKKNPKNSPKSFRRWTCDKEGCGKEMPLFQKGVHLAQHKRIDQDIARMQEALDSGNILAVPFTKPNVGE